MHKTGFHYQCQCRYFITSGIHTSACQHGYMHIDNSIHMFIYIYIYIRRHGKEAHKQPSNHEEVKRATQRRRCAAHEEGTKTRTCHHRHYQGQWTYEQQNRHCPRGTRHRHETRQHHGRGARHTPHVGATYLYINMYECFII